MLALLKLDKIIPMPSNAASITNISGLRFIWFSKLPLISAIIFIFKFKGAPCLTSLIHFLHPLLFNDFIATGGKLTPNY